MNLFIPSKPFIISQVQDWWVIQALASLSSFTIILIFARILHSHDLISNKCSIFSPKYPRSSRRGLSHLRDPSWDPVCLWRPDRRVLRWHRRWLSGFPYLCSWRQQLSDQVQLPLSQWNSVQPTILHLWLVVQCGLFSGTSHLESILVWNILISGSQLLLPECWHCRSCGCCQW